jgi:hypothetical protein
MNVKRDECAKKRDERLPRVVVVAGTAPSVAKTQGRLRRAREQRVFEFGRRAPRTPSRSLAPRTTRQSGRGRTSIRPARALHIEASCMRF